MVKWVNRRGYDEYSYRGSYRRYQRIDFDDKADFDESGEIYDYSLAANHWSGRQRKKMGLGEIRLDEDDIISETPLDYEDPDSEDFEDFTGNAGMTLERWYHHAAILIWPRDKHFSVLCDAGTDAAIGGLQPLVNRLKRMSTAKREKQHREFLSFAAAIIESWQAIRRSSWNEADPVNRGIFLPLLQELGDPDLVRRFLSKVMVGDGGIQLDKSFGKFCQQYGWASFQAELTSVIETTTAATINRNAELLATLCLRRDRNAERIELCARLAERTIKALEALLAYPDQKQGRFSLAKKRHQHLHQIIDRNRNDLTHVTERRGSPFTLVYTKTTASYEAACKINERDLQNLSCIIAYEKKAG